MPYSPAHCWVYEGQPRQETGVLEPSLDFPWKQLVCVAHKIPDGYFMMLQPE